MCETIPFISSTPHSPLLSVCLVSKCVFITLFKMVIHHLRCCCRGLWSLTIVQVEDHSVHLEKKLYLVFVCISSYNHNAIDQVNVIRTIYIWPIGHHIADFTYINIICDKLVFSISFHLFFLFNLIFLMMMNNNNI